MAGETSDRQRASGIWGLFNLDGAPVSAADAKALSLVLTNASSCWLAEGHDAYAPHSVSHHEDPSGSTLLVGDLVESDALADRLGCGRDAAPAMLALCALHRFGNDTPLEMAGEWSLLHRNPQGRLTLMLSSAHRDRLFYAVSGNKVAIAPDLFALARIDWIGPAIDEAGLLFPMGGATVRAGQNGRTMLKAVRQMAPGMTLIIGRDRHSEKFTSDALVAVPRFHGTYADAVAETENLLRRIMRERLANAARPAPTLSGGLDSSLLAWLCAEAQAADCPPVALTSAAPPGSGLADETAFADLVAAHLGISIRHVFPSEEANIYRPTDAMLSASSAPVMANRHCLVAATLKAAEAHDASLVIDGCFGEMSVTSRLPVTSAAVQLRAMAGRLKRAVLRRTSADASMPVDFHVRLAPHRLAALPEPVAAALASAPPTYGESKMGGLFGFTPGVEKALNLPGEYHGGMLRAFYPYRDIRLLRLFAGFPVRMLLEGDRDRGVGREMLKGRLPDSIRLRRRGMPASPDHMVRLQRQAACARQRILLFRKAEIDDWLDLDYLDLTLAAVSARGVASVEEANKVQLTAMAAEFLLWWREQN